jgi:hypothetical protein
MAQIARLKIESEGIPCVLLNENIIATDWLYGNAVGGIQLQVPDRDAARAAAILGQKIPVAEDEEERVKCPSCGSGRTEPSSRFFAFLSILFLGAPLPFFSRRWRCRDCGRLFDPRGGHGFPVGPPDSADLK